MSDIPGAIVDTWSTAWPDALPTRSADDQARLIERTRRAITRLQRAARGDAPPGHALHRRPLLDTTAATLHVHEDVPEALQLGPLTPGACWPVRVRLSSAFPTIRSDQVPDQRGLAVHLRDDARHLDFLATTGEAHHARDGVAMVASLEAAAAAARGGLLGRLGALATLIRALGVGDALRLAKTVSRAAEGGKSLVTLTYFSRAPFQLGRYAVRYRLTPVDGASAMLLAAGDDALSADLRARLAQGPVRWRLQLQGFIDAVRTPMDDHRIAWASPWITVATLVVAADTAPATALGDVEGFRPSPRWDDRRGPVFAPLGDLNALRAAAYAASAQGRRQVPS